MEARVVVCIDTLLFRKKPLYPLRSCCRGGMFRRASEHERKGFGTRSKGLRSTNESPSEQMAYNVAPFLSAYFMAHKERLASKK